MLVSVITVEILVRHMKVLTRLLFRWLLFIVRVFLSSLAVDS